MDDRNHHGWLLNIVLPSFRLNGINNNISPAKIPNPVKANIFMYGVMAVIISANDIPCTTISPFLIPAIINMIQKKNKDTFRTSHPQNCNLPWAFVSVFLEE